MAVERKKKEFSHDLMTTPIRLSNQLKQNEICGPYLEMDVHLRSGCPFKTAFRLKPSILNPYA